MNNLHQPSELISTETINAIEKALEQAWTKDTTDPTELEDWNEKNKALGQCAITAVLIYDLFGGRIIYDKANFHLWNELPDGSQHDFSRSQFKEGRIFTIYKYKTREDVLHDERGKQTQIERRYLKLRQSFNKFTYLLPESYI